MQCTVCRHANRDTAKFCDECGSPLTRVCERCGAALQPHATSCAVCGALPSAVRPPAPTRTPNALERSPRNYTPKHLADKILQSKAALEGERKQVTVLFADVKGSLDLAEQLDAEEWHGILERFFDILTAGVHRFEGTINQYTGDGIMALFGAPIAHEDHAQRAGYAALYARDALRAYADELRLSHGLNFSVRMGMNSGEVVVGKIGDDLRMDYTAQGRAVGVAARMEQLAEPGTVLVTEYTAKLLSGYFALRALGASKVKGVSEPLRIYELRGVGTWQTRFDVSRARGLSRFVGRDRELAALEGSLARAIAGEGQVVGLVAEAGAGKSRLSYEFTQQCRSRGIEVIVACGVPHGRSVPFLPVLQIVRGLCGLTEHDGGDAARRKIAGALLWRDETFREDLPLLFDFLGVSDPNHPGPRAEPEVLQRRLCDVIQRLIHTRAQGGPVVLLFEDLHWIDAASAAALQRLIEAVPAAGTFLLVNFRPEYHAAWMQRAHYQQLPLRALGADATTALLDDLLGPDPTLAPLAACIQERAAGNPFFIEEIVQSLAELGDLVGRRGAYHAGSTTGLILPASVQAALAARIDRLSEGEKEILQAAAVIGKEFTEPVLQRVLLSQEDLAPGLTVLKAHEFIYELSQYPQARYAFKHPLTQEVAYRSQLSGRRERLHAAVARAIEAVHADKLDENAALLAQHWEHAGEALLAAQWHSRAAAWVGARDRSEMLRHWRQVRTLLATVPTAQKTLRLRLMARIQILHNGLFLGQGHQDAGALFHEGVALATELGELSLHIWLLGVYAMVQQQIGAPEEGLVHAREGTRLADTSGESVLRLMIRVSLTWLLLQLGRLHEALAASEDAEAVAAGDPDLGADVLGFSPLGCVLAVRGAALTFLGQLSVARAALERAVAIGQQRNDAEVLIWANVWAVNLYELAGLGREALRHARQAVAAGEVTGSAGMRASAHVALARAALLNGLPAEAIEALNNAPTLAGRRDSASYLDPLQGTIRALGCLALCDFPRARDTAEQAVALAHGNPTVEVAALLGYAQVLLASEKLRASAKIEDSLDGASALIESMDARGLAPFVHAQRAQLARLRGDDVAWRRELEEAHRGFIAAGATGHAERAAKELGR